MSQISKPDPALRYEGASADQPPAIRVSADPPIPRQQREETYTADAAGFEHHERVVRDNAGLEHREETVLDRGTERALLVAKATQFVWLVFGVIEGLIALRVVLRLIGANPQNSFASLVYDLSAMFVGPFLTLTASPAAGRIVLEIPSLIAIGVYALVGWAIVRLLRIVVAPTSVRSVSTYDRFRT
jgi:hypothetical protein